MDAERLVAGQVEALEQAAFAGWPALETAVHRGWALRFAGGYTKRANSANSTAAAEPLDVAGLAVIEDAFTRRGLPPIVRLCSAHAVSAAADALLADRGYRRVDPSLVLWRPLHAADDLAPHGPTLSPDAADWLVHFQACSGKLGPAQAQHLAMLHALVAPHAFGLRAGGGGVAAACGLAVLHQAWLGLFDVATAPAQRRQGHARALCLGLMAWGRTRGAQSAFLQVVGSNAVAQQLYTDLGFRPAYAYHYRVGSPPA